VLLGTVLPLTLKTKANPGAPHGLVGRVEQHGDRDSVG
jgi:hypothetical protein